MLEQLLFAAVLTALTVLFVIRTLIKWDVPDKYEMFRKDWMPPTFCFWCFNFWCSVIVASIVAFSFNLPILTILLVAPASTVIATNLLWEQ